MRRVIPKGLVFTVDLSKLADRELPVGSEMTVDEYRRTIEAPINVSSSYPEPVIIDWGDGSSEVISSGAWPTHTYAADGVYQIMVRSATGHFPNVRFCADNTANPPEKNVTLALTSVDHYAGDSGTQSFRRAFQFTNNLQYVDARIIGQSGLTNIANLFVNSGVAQPFESLCLSFCTNVLNASSAFSYCGLYGAVSRGFLDGLADCSTFNSAFRSTTGLTYIPTDLFDKCVSVESFSSVFRGCNNTALTEPYVFWKEDGTINTDKFPSLTAENAADAYTACIPELRAKVPTAYGGTMTV